MAIMRAVDYAKRYWDMEIPIIDDDNQVLGYEKVKFGKYRLYLGWNPATPGGSQPPPGQQDWSSAVRSYARRLFGQKKHIDLRVKNVWGSEVVMTFRAENEFAQMLPRAVQAFSGKGSREDVQLTLQLAARCGVAAPGTLQNYCDERVDARYPRLGLDCNGFVGNYLRYRNSDKQWIYIDPVSSSTVFNGDMSIGRIAELLRSQAVRNEEEMFNRRMFVLAMVNNAGHVIDGGFGPVGHIMILDAINSLTKQLASSPVPKPYRGNKVSLVPRR